MTEVEKNDRKRIANLEGDESLERVEPLIPKSMHDKLKQKALEKDVSRASIIREALNRWLGKEESIQPNPDAAISDGCLNEILDHCTTYYGGFGIYGEDGFIEAMKADRHKLKDLTSEQWEKVKEKLRIGYAGCTFKPNTKKFVEKFDALEPSKKQKEWLSTETQKAEEIDAEQSPLFLFRQE